ncbi:lytic transglycosylase domain-containing protein [Actinokineospora sp. NPDC004072]
MRVSGVVLRLAVVLAVLGVAAAAVWLVRLASAPTAGPVASDIPALQVPAVEVEPGSVAPVRMGAPAPQGGGGVDPLRGWAEDVAGRTGIPVRALMAYGNAELAVRGEAPGCGLSWATLAGIGRVESDHGRYQGRTLNEDGRASSPIIGVPLDGSPGVKAIPDTDGGALDGDKAVDRAVGPMQFIPSTWARWSADADLDGVGDPHQIDDAALAAARYLCAGGRDLRTPEGWWAGVLSYNNSVEYGQKVFGLAERYARDSRT